MFNDPFANIHNQAQTIINNPGTKFAADMATNALNKGVTDFVDQ